MEVGDVVDGRYRLLELLGEGAAGKVFRAEDRGDNNRFVALKMLHAKDPRWENFFRREFDVLSKLHHPNLVRVYDFGPAPQENSFYFTQELVVGKPVLDIIYGKKVDEVASIFIEICRALEFIHGHGVLHRDLKPANILVQAHASKGERVRVLDFGLWRELETQPQRGARWAGTPPYLASEVLRGFGHSISADLYAVGVTLFQGVTRRLPHGRGTPQELLAARKTKAHDLIGIVAEPLATLIAELLDEVPENRPASAAEVTSRLSVLVPGHDHSMPATIGRARLVGRDKEREEVRNALLAVKESRREGARLLIVSGEDGIGKSRFLQEVKATTQLEGGRAAIGHCGEDVCWAYRPIVDIVRTVAPESKRIEHPDHRQAVERLCTDLGAPVKVEDVDIERFHKHTVDFLLELGANRPFVLIVEDAGFIDAASRDIFEKILARARTSKILVIFSTAKGEGHKAIPQSLSKAINYEEKRIQLNPLSTDDVAELVRALLSVDKIPSALRDTVFAHSKGNPLLVEELVNLFIERGEIKRGEKGWQLEGFDHSVVAPRDLQEILSRRLRGLSEVERRTFCSLAVFNRPAGAKLLGAIGGVSVPEVRKALSGRAALGLIRVVGEDQGKPRVVFRHPRIREVLVADLERGGVLATWHETCAEVLEERSKRNPESMADLLAFHYDKAGRKKDAVAWLERAIVHALDQHAFSDAVTLARRALRILEEEKSASHKGRIHLLMGKALLFSGELARARALFQAPVDELNPRKDGKIIGELAMWFARAAKLLGAIEDNAGWLNRKIEEHRSSKNAFLRARLLLASAELEQHTNPTSAISNAEKALRFLDKELTISDELFAFEALTVSAFSLGECERSVKYARHCLALCEKSGRTLQRVSALRHLSKGLDTLGERIEARKHLNMALRLARRSSHRTEEALLVKTLGDQLFVSGAYKEAITRYQDAVKLSAQMGQHVDRADALRRLAGCYAARGDYKRAIDHARAACEQFESSEQFESAISARCSLANALISSNALDEAQEVWARASSSLPENGLEGARIDVDITAGNLAVRRGTFKNGRAAFLRAAARARSVGDRMSLGEALSGYGQLLLREGKPSRALRMARYAENMFIDLDANGELKKIKPLINAALGLSKKKRRKKRKR